MRDLDLKKAEYQAKRAAATPAKPSQASAKKPQAANNTTEKPKLATQTSGKVTQESAKRANMAEVTAKSHEAVKKMGTLEEEFHAKPEEPAKTSKIAIEILSIYHFLKIRKREKEMQLLLWLRL